MDNFSHSPVFFAIAGIIINIVLNIKIFLN